MTSQIVLFGVGSPITVEFAETCRRLGWSIAASVKNRDGEVYADDDNRVFDAIAVDSSLLAYPCLCPLFTPANRAAAVREAKALGFRFTLALIDPSVITSQTTGIGKASYVNAGCIIGAKTLISDHVLINRGASIGHHARIGACASIGPGAIVSGSVSIETGAMVGAGAILLPKVKVGAFAIVGAGSVVTRDVPARAMVVGNPAQAIEFSLPEFEIPA